VIKGEEKAWDRIEQPLRRFLCRALQGFIPENGKQWRAFVRQNTRQGVAVDRFADLEIQRLFEIVKGNLSGGGEKECVLFQAGNQHRRLPDYVRYLCTLRNKYEHEHYISATEQVADLFLIRRVVDELKGLDTTGSSQTADLLALIDASVREYLDQASQAGLLPTAVVEPSEQLDDELLAGLSAVQETLARFEARLPEADGRQPGETTTDQIVLSKELLSQLDVRMSALYQFVTGRLAKELEALTSSLAGLSESTSRVGEYRIASEQPSISRVAEPASIYAAARKGAPDPQRARPIASADRKYSSAEIRDQLINLRSRIWRELGTGPSADGLLRRSMIDLLVQYRVTSEKEFYDRLPPYAVTATSRPQLAYLPEVCRIVAGLAP
jgi:hypothetical protein